MSNFNTNHQAPSIINMENISANPRNPRTDLGDLSDLEASIKANGLLQPIVVRHNGSNKRYEVVAGSRRFQACQNIGLDAIPAIVVDVTEDKAVELATTENIVRKEMSPTDECRAIMAMVDSGKNIRDIAAEFGRTVRWALCRDKMARLGEEILGMMDEGELTLAHAEVLTMCNDDKDVMQFAKMASYTSPEKMKAQILAKKANLSKAPFDVKTVCKNCKKKTICQEDIFGDVSESYCQDSECFLKNLEAFINGIKDEYIKKGYREYDGNWEWGFRNGFSWINEDKELSDHDKEVIRNIKKKGLTPFFLVNDSGEVLVRWKRNEGDDECKNESRSVSEAERKHKERVNNVKGKLERAEVKERVEEILGGLHDVKVALLLAAFTTNTYDYIETNEDGQEVEVEDSPLNHIGETYTDNNHNEGIAPIDLLIEEVVDGLCGYYGIDDEHAKYFELEKLNLAEKAEKIVREEEAKAAAETESEEEETEEMDDDQDE